MVLTGSVAGEQLAEGQLAGEQLVCISENLSAADKEGTCCLMFSTVFSSSTLKLVSLRRSALMISPEGLL